MSNHIHNSYEKVRIVAHQKHVFRAVSIPMIRVKLKPLFRRESERYCHDPLEKGYEPFDYKEYQCQVLVDGQQVTTSITQDYDELIVTFPCPLGQHDVVIYHVLAEGDKEYTYIDLANRIEVNSVS